MKNLFDWQKKYQQKEKISMITCYESWLAKLIAQTDIDAILVGDSVAQVVHGYDSTIHANLAMMTTHCQAVVRHLRDRFIIGDMPFLSYNQSIATTITAVDQLMKTGVNAVKMEGGHPIAETIRHIVQAGVPVMGHLGLTPQSVHQLGGYRIQGRNKPQAQQLIADAKILEEAGCFAIVLECIPAELGETITQQLNIPTIGIGAGRQTSGQILVAHDMLGLNDDFSAKFVRKFSNGFQQFHAAMNDYHRAVQAQDFPAQEHEY